MMKARIRTASVLFAAAALTIAACGDDDGDASGDTTAETEAAEAATEETTADTAAAEEEAADEEAAAEEEADQEATETVAEEAVEEETEESTIPERSGDADLVFWLDETRATALEPVINQFAEENGLNVQISEVAYDPTRNAVTQAAPAGEGPDIFAGAHDWVGEFAASGIVAPVDLGPSEADYNPVAVEGVTVDGTVYGLPYAVENIALIRNTDLVPEAPATWDELEQTAMGLQADVPIAVEIANGAAPYHLYPIYSSFGGYVFGGEPGAYDTSDIGLDSPEGLAAANAFGEYFDSGLLSADVDGDIVRTTFSGGDAPFAITGPWNIPNFEDAGVNFAIDPIPSAGGEPSAPFVGVQTFYVSAFSENLPLAEEFLLSFVNTPETMQALYDAQPRTPAYLPTYDAVQDDPLVAGFGAAGEDGQPLPNVPEMGEVWTPWQDAYVAIAGGTNPEQAFTDAADAIRAALN